MTNFNNYDFLDEEMAEFNRYYSYVENLIAIQENLPDGKFSKDFEYTFLNRKNHTNLVSYYHSGKKGSRRKADIKTIEVIPFEQWYLLEKRNKLLGELGI
jgi:hypothetical protein